MSTPQAPDADQSSAFVVDPNGWYGILSLRPPAVHFDAAHSGVSWPVWLARLVGTPLVNAVSCVNDIMCWVAQPDALADPITAFPAWVDDNPWVLHMLGTLSPATFGRIQGSAVFTGWHHEKQVAQGLSQEQFAPVAAAYRLAQRKLMTELVPLDPENRG